MMKTDLSVNEQQQSRELTTTDMMVSRQAQEVQAAMIVAKRFPRDEAIALDRIKRACQRVGLAKQAEYTYPRGGQKISGPTIRLAEALAQSWGNIDYGVIELEQKEGFSELMAYAWDLETNTRVTKIFTVKHVRDTKQGSKVLTDGRDIYEATANFGARRVRACILGVIPGDVVEDASKTCKKTLTGAHKTPIDDRFRVIIATFESEYMVSKTQIEEYLGYDIKSANENDYIRMQGVYRSLRDGMSKPVDFFKPAASNVGDPFKKPEAQPAQTQPPAQAPSDGTGQMTEEEKAEILEAEKKQAK